MASSFETHQRSHDTMEQQCDNEDDKACSRTRGTGWMTRAEGGPPWPFSKVVLFSYTIFIFHTNYSTENPHCCHQMQWSQQKCRPDMSGAQRMFSYMSAPEIEHSCSFSEFVGPLWPPPSSRRRAFMLAFKGCKFPLATTTITPLSKPPKLNIHNQFWLLWLPPVHHQNWGFALIVGFLWPPPWLLPTHPQNWARTLNLNFLWPLSTTTYQPPFHNCQNWASMLCFWRSSIGPSTAPNIWHVCSLPVLVVHLHS